MTNDIEVTDEIMTNYVTFLLSGHSIKDIDIRADTIKGYMRVVNAYYKMQGYNRPFDTKSKSDAARLLKEQEKFEQDPARRAALPDIVIAKMCDLAEASNPLGFRATAWDATGLGRFTGARQQEFAMDTRNVIKKYVLPNGVQVTRAYCVRNFHYRDANRAPVDFPLVTRDRIVEVGPQYDVQKNRRNGQIVWFRREPRHPKYCPVNISLNILWRATTLGQGPDDPIFVYQDDSGSNKYLTGSDMTEYFRFVTKLVIPSTSDEDLKLISTHSIRVTACVLLAEAGKEGWYIKIRLRWLSDCYEIYIRNTRRIADQHNEALDAANRKLDEVAVTLVNLPDYLEESGILDTVQYDIEDED